MSVLAKIHEIIARANAHDASTNDPNTAWDALHEIDMLVMQKRIMNRDLFPDEKVKVMVSIDKDYFQDPYSGAMSMRLIEVGLIVQRTLWGLRVFVGIIDADKLETLAGLAGVQSVEIVGEVKI